MHDNSIESGSGQPASLGRVDRRAATAFRRTTNGVFSARYLRACGVSNDGDKRRRFPRARAPSGLRVAVCDTTSIDLCPADSVGSDPYGSTVAVLPLELKIVLPILVDVVPSE